MNQETQHQDLKVVLHAPTPVALERARNNAMNLKRERPDVEVRIIANAGAVAAALDNAHSETDAFTWLCPNSLARTNRANRQPLRAQAGAAVLQLAELQRNGWVYIRS